jgi:crotonobetainyl-CoA:carnitine CoA-transferase CaiB-like acyl-CoA transferase
MRYFSERTPSQEKWWEWGTSYNYVNTNKRGITLDLGREDGRTILTRLIGSTDILVDNFTPRVMDSFGLSWETVRKSNPYLLMVRMPAFGLSGPWKDRPGYAYTIEQVTGMAWLTGYRDGPPITPGGPPDLLVGIHAAFITMAALEERSRSSVGHLVEVSMVDVGLNTAAEVVIEASAYNATLTRDGNRGPVAAPQGTYPCSESGQWIALAVETDAQWYALRGLLGRPPWAMSQAFNTEHGRRAAHDTLDRELAEWCSHWEVERLAEVFASAGIPAGVVAMPEALRENPQVAERGFIEDIEHPVTGARRLAGLPFRLRSHEGPWIRSAAPTLGQDNEEILGKWAGLTEEEISELYRNGVIGASPIGA